MQSKLRRTKKEAVKTLVNNFVQTSPAQLRSAQNSSNYGFEQISLAQFYSAKIIHLMKGWGCG